MTLEKLSCCLAHPMNALRNLKQKINEVIAAFNDHLENHPAGEGGGGGEPQLQADWNQQDSTAVDFIKNKPFGDENVSFVPTQSFTDEVDGALLTFDLTPDIGTPLTIIYDGLSYPCEAGDFYGMGVAAGNTDLLMGGTGDGSPLVMWAQGQCVVMAVEKNVPHTISVIGTKTNKIPAKFIDRTKYYFISATDGTGYIYKDYFQQEMVTAAEYLATAQAMPILLQHDTWKSDSAGNLSVTSGNVYFPTQMSQDGSVVCIVIAGAERKVRTGA